METDNQNTKMRAYKKHGNNIENPLLPKAQIIMTNKCNQWKGYRVHKELHESPKDLKRRSLWKLEGHMPVPWTGG